MRSIIALSLVGLLAAACNNQDKKATGSEITKDNLEVLKDPVPLDTAKLTSIQWLDSTYLDLGQQKEGKSIEISFRFRNTGDKNLVIEDVSAQCGCTIPEKPEQPFAPGEEGVIRAKFNGSGHDETRKQVYVKANIKPDGADTLTFRAQLVK